MHVAVEAARTQPFAKRLLDVLLGSVLLLLSLPIVLLASLAIVLTDGGSPLYAQERVGLNGRTFRIFKLRTMVRNAHDLREGLLHLNEADGPVFKIKNDPRLHPLGKLLRRTSIDELPNLLNVLRGEMSLVGPRPPLPCEVERYDAYAMRRLSVTPGITGLWQIRGRSCLPFDEWMRLDNEYIDTWSLRGDVAILLKTIPAVVRRDGAH